MSDRTPPIISDHLTAITTALATASLPFPVGEWQRPVDLDERFEAPPYALVRAFPSTGQFEGPLSDSQVDIMLRVQILGVGYTQLQSITVTDLCRAVMVKSNLIITGRRVQDIRYMVVSGGVSRDDDLPTPYFYSSDLYELLTTPA